MNRKSPRRESSEELAQVEALMKAGRFDVAQSVLQDILAENPDDLDALGLWLELHIKTGTTEAKLTAMNRLLTSAQRKKRLRQAWALLNWLGESYDDPVLKVPRWEIHFENDRVDLAWGLLRKILAANPRLAPFYRSRFTELRGDDFLLGKLLLLGAAARDSRILTRAFRGMARLGDLPHYLDEVLEKVLPAAKNNPDFPVLEAGRILLRLGKPIEAAAFLEQAAMAGPALSGKVLEVLNRLPSPALEIPEIVVLHARVLCAAGRHGSARDALRPGSRKQTLLDDIEETLETRGGSDPTGLFLRGAFHEAGGERSRALEMLRQCAETLSPARLPALSLLGDIYLADPFDETVPEILAKFAADALDAVLEDELDRISRQLAEREDELVGSSKSIESPARLLLALLPESAELTRLVARAAISEGDEDGAEELLARFLDAHPTDASALEAAVSDLVGAVPKRWSAHEMRVEALLGDGGRKDEALEALVAGIRGVGKHEDEKVALALRVLIAKPNRGRHLEPVSEALHAKMRPRKILAAALPEASKNQASARVLSKLLELGEDGGGACAKVARGLWNLHRQDDDGAASAFREALLEDAKLADLVDDVIRSFDGDGARREGRSLMAGDLQLARGAASEAADRFHEFLEAHPEETAILEERVAKLLDLDDGCARAYLLRARIRAGSGDVAEVVSDYEKAFAGDADLADPAVAGLRALGEDHPTDVACRRALLAILTEGDRIDEAVEVARELAGLPGDAASFIASRMTKATSTQPKHAGAWLARGRAEFETGAGEDAARSLRIAVDLDPAQAWTVETILDEGAEKTASSADLTHLIITLLIAREAAAEALTRIEEALESGSLEPGPVRELIDGILEKDAGNVAALRLRAATYSTEGQPDEEARGLRSLVEKYPSEREAAIERLSALIETEGAGVAVGQTLAYLQAQAEDAASAAETLRDSIRRFPEFESELLADLTRLAADRPDAQDVQATLVRTLLDVGDAASATAATARLHARDPDETEEVCRGLIGSILAADPTQGRPHLVLATMEIRKRAFDTAVVICGEARETDTARDVAFLGEVRELLERILKEAPEHAAATLQLAETLRLAGDQEGAVAAYLRAVELDAESLETVRGGIEDCLRENPSDAALHLALGRMEETHGKGRDHAIELYTRGLREVGDGDESAPLRAARGRCRLAAGSNREAFDDLRAAARIVSLSREDADFIRVAWRGNLEDEVEKRMKRKEKPAPALGTAGLLFRLARYEDCIAHLQAHAPEEPAVAARFEYLKGLAFLRSGLLEEARGSLEFCASSLPESGDLAKHARHALSRCLESMGRYEEALAAVAGVNRVDAGFPQIGESRRRISEDLMGRSSPPDPVIELSLRDLRPRLDALETDGGDGAGEAT